MSEVFQPCTGVRSRTALALRARGLPRSDKAPALRREWTSATLPLGISFHDLFLLRIDAACRRDSASSWRANRPLPARLCSGQNRLRNGANSRVHKIRSGAALDSGRSVAGRRMAATSPWGSGADRRRARARARPYGGWLAAAARGRDRPRAALYVSQSKRNAREAVLWKSRSPWPSRRDPPHPIAVRKSIGSWIPTSAFRPCGPWSGMFHAKECSPLVVGLAGLLQASQGDWRPCWR